MWDSQDSQGRTPVESNEPAAIAMAPCNRSPSNILVASRHASDFPCQWPPEFPMSSATCIPIRVSCKQFFSFCYHCNCKFHNPVVKLYQNQLECSPLVSLHSPLSYGKPLRSDRCSVLSCLVWCDLLSEVLRWPRSPGQSSCRRPTRKAILSIAVQSIISSERDTVWKCLLPVGYGSSCLAAAWTLFEQLDSTSTPLLCWLWNETIHRVTCQLKFFRDSMQHLNWTAWGDFSFVFQDKTKTRCSERVSRPILNASRQSGSCECTRIHL